MADEREPRIELLRPTPTERAVAPVRAPAPVRARAEVTELYRRTDEQAPPGA